MPDESSNSPISFQTVRNALGRNEESDLRVEILILIAKHGPVNQEWLRKRLEGRRGATAVNVGKHAARLADDDFIEIEKSAKYSATPIGRRIALELEALRTGSMASDLIGRVLVTATRAREDDTGSLRTAMLQRAEAVLTGFGSLAYVAVCDDDPDLVEELQGRIEKHKAEASMLRVSQVLTR